MDSNQYYQDLIQQGYSSADAANFTQQYYPDFQGTMQGMSMMTPPPPGSLEMGAGLVGQGAGGLAAGGLVGTATGAAAAGGGMSMATIAVVSVLVLGGVGTGGYFLYDYLTEPDFYGEIYWYESGGGYIFEEDGMSLVWPNNNQGDWDCGDYGYGTSISGNVSEKDGICYFELGDEYKSTDKGDYYRICLTTDGAESCLDLYPKEQGAFMGDGDNCTILVSDISVPNWDDEDLEGYRETWLDKFDDVADEIKKDIPSSCEIKDISGNTGESPDIYQFSGRDAINDPAMNASGGDALIHIMMVDRMSNGGLNWVLVEVTISVDGGAPRTCDFKVEADEYSSCVYTIDDDMYWNVSEEITISEGSDTDLCDGSNGYCVIDVTISKKAIGNDDDEVIGQLTVAAEA